MTVLLREAIGDSIRRARTGRSRTLRDVSRDARVSLGYLSEVERGRKEPSSELLAAICEALSLPLPDLLDDAAATMRPLAAPRPAVDPALRSAVDPALRSAVDPALRSAVEEAFGGADEAHARAAAIATRRGGEGPGSVATDDGADGAGVSDALPAGSASGVAGGDDAGVGSAAALALAERRAVGTPGPDAVAGTEVGDEADRGAHPDALRRGLVVGAPADEVVPLTPGTVSLVARLPVTPAGPVDAVVRAA